jgi:hypothetical protein
MYFLDVVFCHRLDNCVKKIINRGEKQNADLKDYVKNLFRMSALLPVLALCGRVFLCITLYI